MEGGIYSSICYLGIMYCISRLRRLHSDPLILCSKKLDVVASTLAGEQPWHPKYVLLTLSGLVGSYRPLKEGLCFCSRKSFEKINGFACRKSICIVHIQTNLRLMPCLPHLSASSHSTSQAQSRIDFSDLHLE